MCHISLKASAALAALITFSTLAAAENLPKQSSDFIGNYNIAIKDNKARPETALCSATAHDLTKNKKYTYDRFGFTQADYNAVTLQSTNKSAKFNVKLNGEARLRSGEMQWMPITIECVVANNKMQSISVTAKK